MEELTDEIMSEAYSGIISNGEILPQEPLFLNNDSEDDDEGEVDDIIVLHMDIRQPLSTLRTILEQRVGVPLKNFDFWLQNAQMLESHKNLVDQCVQGEGIVQINVQVITMTRRINIVDVLKPTEEIMETAKKDDSDVVEESKTKTMNTENGIQRTVAAVPDENDDSSNSDDKIIKWCPDKRFRNDQLRLGIPNNPIEWTMPMVRHWLQWAVRQFNLTHIKLQDWTITGRELCNMKIDEFHKKVPNDPNDIFWTHFELLRACKMVAVIQKNPRNKIDSTDDEGQMTFRKNMKQEKARNNKMDKTFDDVVMTPPSHTTYDYPPGNRTGSNGQIQLWQFLLEILTDRNCRNIIHWMDGNGEFKLSDPERVAQLWGERKNKPAMNYEKLSRALRYYYDGDMISKVHGKRFVYQFVCDLRQLIGYSAEELAKLVNEKPLDEINVDRFNLNK